MRAVDAVGMPGRPRPLPSSLSFPVFTALEARRVGLPSSRLRAADVRALDRGLWARVGQSVTEADIVAALCRRDDEVFAMGLTAARLWGIPLPGILDEGVVSAPVAPRRVKGKLVYRPRGRSVDRRIHLAAPGARSPRQGTALVRWSHLDVEPVPLEAMPTVRITTRLRTLLDLAGLLRPEALVAIGDHLVRRPRPEFEKRSVPFATVAELEEAAERFRGRGALKLREAVSRVRVSADSPAETRLRLAVVAAGLPEPLANERAMAATDEAGRSLDLGEPDLHWPRWRVILEHEGPNHLSAEQQARDIKRGERRTRAGWIEVRTTAGDLENGCRKGVARARDALRRHGWAPR